MKKLMFRAYADGSFGECFVTNKFVYNEGYPISFKVMSGENGVIVTGRHSPHDCSGCWEIGIQPISEDADFPWDIRVRFTAYTPALEINAPDDVTVEPE